MQQELALTQKTWLTKELALCLQRGAIVASSQDGYAGPVLWLSEAIFETNFHLWQVSGLHAYFFYECTWLDFLLASSEVEVS